MATVESRLEELGLVLPEPMILPPGAIISFPWVRIHGNRAFISGHGPLKDDGSLWTPLGKVGAEVSPEEAYVAARQVGLAILSSLKRELGDLDRVTCWLKILGMVNSAPGFNRQPSVINGFTDLIVATGPGTATQLKILDGQDQTKVLFELAPFEAAFTGAQERRDVADLDRDPRILERVLGERTERATIPLDDRRHELGDDDLRVARERVERRAQREAHSETTDQHHRPLAEARAIAAEPRELLL